jgi:carbon starvation protein
MDNESEARMIGYGGMVAEGILSTMAVIACTAGIATVADWNAHYVSWGAAAGLGPKLSAFVIGGTRFVGSYGIPGFIATAIVGVLVVSFAMTTIDSATRLQRYILQEWGKNYNIGALKNRYVATTIAVGTAAIFALWGYGGKEAGMILWPLFGTTNQLLAALALLTITIWLIKMKKPSIYTFIPMIFMMFITIFAMIYTITQNYIPAHDWLLTVLGSIILALAVWLLFEASVAIKRVRAKEAEKSK